MSGGAQHIDSGTETDFQRLQRHNPFVARLSDRQGARRDYLQFFDGKSNLISHPMRNFDGYPLENEYYLFLPTVLLVSLSVLLPLLAVVKPMPVAHTVLAAAVYLVLVAVLSVTIAFRLISIRTKYISANSDVLAADFASKARGIRILLHTFKSIVRWRRFMRYTMNLGDAALLFLFLTEAVKLAHNGSVLGTPLTMKSFEASVVLMAIGAASFALFEVGRKRLTEGMDPTLALALMIEEIGGQLLASRQTKLVGSGDSG